MNYDSNDEEFLRGVTDFLASHTPQTAEARLSVHYMTEWDACCQVYSILGAEGVRSFLNALGYMSYGELADGVVAEIEAKRKMQGM